MLDIIARHTTPSDEYKSTLGSDECQTLSLVICIWQMSEQDNEAVRQQAPAMFASELLFAEVNASIDRPDCHITCPARVMFCTSTCIKYCHVGIRCISAPWGIATPEWERGTWLQGPTTLIIIIGHTYPQTTSSKTSSVKGDVCWSQVTYTRLCLNVYHYQIRTTKKLKWPRHNSVHAIFELHSSNSIRKQAGVGRVV